MAVIKLLAFLGLVAYMCFFSEELVCSWQRMFQLHPSTSLLQLFSFC